MEEKTYIYPTSCGSCGQTISSEVFAFTKLKAEGKKITDIMRLLGITRTCCRTTILSPSPYYTHTSQKGGLDFLSINMEDTRVVYHTKNKSLGYVSSSGVEKIIDDDNIPDVSNIKLGDLIENEPKIEEPVPLPIFKSFPFNQGYVRDDNGNIQVERVGEKAYVPVLQISFKF